jgi:hypothetical protein
MWIKHGGQCSLDNKDNEIFVLQAHHKLGLPIFCSIVFPNGVSILIPCQAKFCAEWPDLDLSYFFSPESALLSWILEHPKVYFSALKLTLKSGAV